MDVVVNDDLWSSCNLGTDEDWLIPWQFEWGDVVASYVGPSYCVSYGRE